MERINQFIPELWASQIARAYGYAYEFQSEILKRQLEELRWLRRSLEADVLPDWCIEMVMMKWAEGQVDEWTHR